MKVMSKAEDIIKKDMIFLQQDDTDMKSILNLLVYKAKEINLVTESEDYLDSVLKREKEVSTAIGYDVAIPHGKSSSVTEPFIGFVTTSETFRWSSDDEELVNMVFLIGVPEENKDNIHLKFISTLSKKLLDDEFREQLQKAVDREEAYKILTSVNKEIKEKIQEA